MNLSAILVTTTPDNTLNMIETLNNIQNIEVFHHDKKSGEIIIIQKAKAIHKEVYDLKKIKALPGIIMTKIVEYYFDKDIDTSTSATASLSS